MSRFSQLTERRVPQYLAVYLGAGGMIEFTSLLEEERYAIAPPGSVRPGSEAGQ